MELFTIILCVAVFLILTFTLSLLIYKLFKASRLNIKNGSFDSQIIKEEQTISKKKKTNIFSSVFLGSIQIILIVLIGYSLGTRNAQVNGIARPSVVLSNSMSEKNKENSYLVDNDLNDQFNSSDLIFIEALPEKINKYDIIVYLKDDNLIIHRVIEEKQDEKGETYYLLRGDANNRNDAPVYRDQMIGIYRGHKISYVGLFIRFLQSFPGVLCVLLAFIASIVTPILNDKLDIERKLRLNLIKSNRNQKHL